MNKWMSWVLVVCMFVLLPLGAMADEAEVLQDAKAPELISAAIYDAAGAEVSKIDTAACVDVSERTSVAALQAAYDAIMASVHCSQIVLNGADNFDAVLVELFDVAFDADDTAALATAGNVAVLTFAMEQPVGVVAFSADGAAWANADYTVNADGSVTVRTTTGGSVAFLTDIGDAAKLDTDYEIVVVPTPDDSLFTPSVAGKTAPTLVTVPGAASDECIAVITTGTGSSVEVLNDGKLVITPVSERAYNADIQTYEHLSWAYAQILTAANIGALTTEGGATIAADVDAQLTGLTSADMIVRDLFEVSAYGEYAKAMCEADSTITMTFDVDMNAGDALVVLVSSDSANWSVLPAANVTINADGSVTVTMDDLGAVAFAVGKTAKPGTVTSPAT